MKELTAVANEENIPVQTLKLTTKEEAQNALSAFATFAIFYNGEFVTHKIPSQKEFKKLLSKIIK